MSGYTDDAALRHGIDEVGTYFLQKPISLGMLARKVRDILERAENVQRQGVLKRWTNSHPINGWPRTTPLGVTRVLCTLRISRCTWPVLISKDFAIVAVEVFSYSDRGRLRLSISAGKVRFQPQRLQNHPDHFSDFMKTNRFS
jgi:hypothetical protein